MALITCPICGKQFSEHAKACPQCGTPYEDVKGQLGKKMKNVRQKKHVFMQKNTLLCG